MAVIAAMTLVAAERDNPPMVVHQRPGTEKALAALKQEDLSQSIQVIITGGIEQYLIPGSRSSAYGRPPDLDRMLSNRRVIKVMQDIQALPEDERGQECNRLFSKALLAHTNACRTVIMHEQNPSSPANRQSMLSSKMGLSAALFITAELGRLDLLGKQLKTLDEWNKEIEPLAYTPSPNPGHGTLLDDAYIAPDYELQVNVMRLGVLRAGNTELLKQVDVELASIGMRTNTLQIVPWNAETTAFEVFPNPLDTSKGVTTYTFYYWTGAYITRGSREDREIQKSFVDRLRSIVFNKGMAR